MGGVESMDGWEKVNEKKSKFYSIKKHTEVMIPCLNLKFPKI